MSLRRPSRPARTESGVSLVEVMVATMVIVTAIFASASLLAQLITRTAVIGEAEQARMVAYEVAETSRAYRCGQVYGTETDLDAKIAACSAGLQRVSGNAPGDCSGSGAGIGDTRLCWKVDGNRRYDVIVTTWWEISSATPTVCPSSGTTTMPDLFVRKIQVKKEGTTPVLAEITVREAAQTDPPLTGTLYFHRASSGPASVTVGSRSHVITHSGPDPSCPSTLFPGVPLGSTAW